MKYFFSQLLLIYIYFSIFISSIKTEDTQQNEFYHIVDGSLNGTAKFVSLSTISAVKKDLYFTFDFDYHYNALSSNKDIAYFKLTSPLEYYKTDERILLSKPIRFIFLEQKWTEIKQLDSLELNKKFWAPTTLIFFQKDNYGNYEYFISVKRSFNQKTLLLKVPTLGETTGDIVIENLITLPENLQKSLTNNHFNRDFYSGNRKYGRNHLHGNNYQHQNQHQHQHVRENGNYYLSGWGACLGVILGQIWIVVLILYCLVNRRRKTITGFSVVVNDSTNQRPVNNANH